MKPTLDIIPLFGNSCTHFSLSCINIQMHSRPLTIILEVCRVILHCYDSVAVYDILPNTASTEKAYLQYTNVVIVESYGYTI